MPSRVAQLLAEKRAAQIRRMEGDDVDDSEIDAEIAAFASRTKPRRRNGMKSRRLEFSPHARKRMAQRGIDARTLYAIWRVGEERRQDHGRRAYVVTRKSLDAATFRDAQLTEPWSGCAIVVADLPRGPMLVTVLAAGEDTRVPEIR